MTYKDTSTHNSMVQYKKEPLAWKVYLTLLNLHIALFLLQIGSLQGRQKFTVYN